MKATVKLDGLLCCLATSNDENAIISAKSILIEYLAKTLGLISVYMPFYYLSKYKDTSYDSSVLGYLTGAISETGAVLCKELESTSR